MSLDFFKFPPGKDVRIRFLGSSPSIVDTFWVRADPEKLTEATRREALDSAVDLEMCSKLYGQEAKPAVHVHMIKQRKVLKQGKVHRRAQGQTIAAHNRIQKKWSRLPTQYYLVADGPMQLLRLSGSLASKLRQLKTSSKG